MNNSDIYITGNPKIGAIGHYKSIAKIHNLPLLTAMLDKIANKQMNVDHEVIKDIDSNFKPSEQPILCSKLTQAIFERDFDGGVCYQVKLQQFNKTNFSNIDFILQQKINEILAHIYKYKSYPKNIKFNKTFIKLINLKIKNRCESFNNKFEIIDLYLFTYIYLIENKYPNQTYNNFYIDLINEKIKGSIIEVTNKNYDNYYDNKVFVVQFLNKNFNHNKHFLYTLTLILHHLKYQTLGKNEVYYKPIEYIKNFKQFKNIINILLSDKDHFIYEDEGFLEYT